MNTEHTPASLIAYEVPKDSEPGRWRIGTAQHAIARILPSGDGNLDESRARRIVACVNACAGIPLERLESEGATSLRDATAIRDQRDELAAALRNFRAWYADHFEDFSSAINAELLCIDNDASAALAKLET